MAFLDELRAYLERPVPPPHVFTLDLPAHHQHLIDALERLERSGAAGRHTHDLLEHYSPLIGLFVQEMGQLLMDGMAHGATPDELASLINIALDRQLGLSTSTGSRVRDAELDRLWRIASHRIDEISPSKLDLVSRYARGIRAVKRAQTDLVVTPIGRLILELPDRDALRFMFAVEASQSLGKEDEWRLSRTAARQLLDEPTGFRDFSDEEVPSWPVPWDILYRLARTGLVDIDDEDPAVTVYELLPEGRALLEEIASGEPTPFSVLAEALLQDETAAVLGQLRPAAALVQREGAAAATTRHARMVAHEIRNALVPVQAALGSLYRDVERQVDATLLERHRGSIDGGIARVFQFIKEMVEVAARGGEPAEPFEVTPAIEGAVAAVVPELALQVSLAFPARLPPVVGHRSRFTLAIVNLLRNAGQARDQGVASARITAEISPTGDAITVTVDDDGPGVPSEMREAIFRPGFSLRPGGSGEGLALVREVVEGELGGRATCEDGPSGGARFVLRIPVREGGAGR